MIIGAGDQREISRLAGSLGWTITSASTAIDRAAMTKSSRGEGWGRVYTAASGSVRVVVAV
ncbi:MAG: hypothetical protein OHK0022_25280 [Roseiflexaceae bacterium]